MSAAWLKWNKHINLLPAPDFVGIPESRRPPEMDLRSQQLKLWSLDEERALQRIAVDNAIERLRRQLGMKKNG